MGTKARIPADIPAPPDDVIFTPPPASGRRRSFVLYGTSVFFMLAGINHFVMPEWYMANQMPPWVPFPTAALIISGIAEMLGGFGLLVTALRRWACWGLVALLVLVFPGNIHMLSASMQATGWSGETFGLILRLPFQSLAIIVLLWLSRDQVD